MTLVAGGNNAGKSTLLQGLAVWEFCKVATLAQRGPEGLLDSRSSSQGFGLGDDEFSPINIPSLKHLWTNLKTQKTDDDADGYTLSVACVWQHGGKDHELEFNLALANDRLFIKVSNSTLQQDDKCPIIAYLPPFAGISAREERTYGALRRRRIGEGLAGAILRNLLLDMRDSNIERREELRSGLAKIRAKDLKHLREEDPWELLQQTLREVFSAELSLKDFDEEYHTYIQVFVEKGEVDGYKLTRHPGYNPRDLMVEGSGFLQWLSVYTLATSPVADVLLFDEPDAHLHAALQSQLVERLGVLTKQFNKQVLLATHSSEILRQTAPARILEVRSGGKFNYLSEDQQKVSLMVGIGSDYAPKIDRIRTTKKVFFFEGSTDLDVLKLIAGRLNVSWPTNFAEWQTSDHHKERRLLWRALRTEYGDISALSLRDRDDDAPGTVADDLRDKSEKVMEGFTARKWRRRYMESYLVVPRAISAASGKPESEVRKILQEEMSLVISDSTFQGANPPSVVRDLRGKDVLDRFNLTAHKVAKNLLPHEICEDLEMMVGHIRTFAEG